MVRESLDGTQVLLGEAKRSARPFDRRTLEAALSELAVKPPPPRLAGARLIRALFVPAAKPGVQAETPEGPTLITATDLLGG